AVSKEELIHSVWPNSFVSDDSLVQNISAIRRALGDDASQPQYIATLARRGYHFIAHVEEHTGHPETAHSVTKDVFAPQRLSVASPVAVHRPGLWRTAAAFATGVVVAVFALSGL